MDLVKQGTPLDWELARRRAELARLERRMAEHEVELDAFKARLAAFGRRYFEVFAPLYAEVDELEAQVAEKASRVRPKDASKRRKAEKLRARASGEVPLPQAPVAPKPRASDELKTVYRALSKLIHPDLGVDAEERQHREALMVQANAAYAAGNLDLLSYLLNGWDVGHAPAGNDVEAVLERVMSQIAQAGERLAEADRARAMAEETDLARLMRRVESAEAEGRDLFKKFREELDEHLRHLRKRAKALDRRISKREKPEA